MLEEAEADARQIRNLKRTGLCALLVFAFIWAMPEAWWPW